MDSEINKTLITLIPKVANPVRLQEFRPISLCTVIYKIISKVLSNRLKPLLPNLILQKQSSFVGGRNITDNVIIAQEVIHSMRSKKDVEGWMAIKVDLEKAYDRLRWDFIEDTLKDAGLPSKFVQAAMLCISSCSMQILWNG